MPDLKGGGSSRKRERSLNPSADASERDRKKAKTKKKTRRAKKKLERKKRTQAAAAAQADGGKPTGQKEPAVAAPATRKKSTGKNTQKPSNLDPVEKVKQQVAKGLRRHPNKIKKPVDHTGVEVLSHHAPHKIKAEGYVFVPAGSRYITLNCRRLTLQSGRNVWKIDHPKGKGIQVPKEIYKTVIANEAATRTQRSEIVAKIDKKENEEALKCLLKLFPNLPPGASDEILQRAWQKSSGRVGRTKKLTMEQKVRLAVVAHVRHCHTSYEKRLRDEVSKNGGQRAPAKAVRRIKSQIWGEVNAVVKSWQKTGAQVAQVAKSITRERVIPQQNPHRGPAPPKTQWQQNVEQGFVVTHPPINRPRPIFIRHEERRKLEGEKSKKTETKPKQKKTPVEVILIDSDSEEDIATGANIPETINLQDAEEMEGCEIMEGNSNDWDAAVGNAQDWDIGGDDEESDVDENCFFYPDEEVDEDYVESERGLGSGVDEDDEEEWSDHDMDSKMVQDEFEEEQEKEEEEDEAAADDDYDDIMAESDEPIKRDEAPPVKQENDKTVLAPAGLLGTIPAESSAVSQTNNEVNPHKILSDLEHPKVMEEIGETVSTPTGTESTILNKASVTVSDLNPRVEEAKESVREEDSIRSVLEKAARISKEEEEELRSAVEADEDEIYRDFGF